MNWLLVASGIALLVMGGEALVRGASGVALLARVRPAIIGLTIVAAGTSMPELVVSLRSALEGSPGIAVGNVVGSNIFNIAAILGLTALMRPLVIQGNTVRFEWPVMMAATVLFHIFLLDSDVTRIEASVLLTGMIAFLGYAVWLGRKAVTAAEEQEYEEVTTASFGLTGLAAIATNVGAIIAGCLLLTGGSAVLVSGAVGIASSFGISDAIVGLTIVAAGTSTPELVTSLVAARRSQHDIAIGNIVGSNIFNILGIAGATALVHPLTVPDEIVSRDSWWMLAISALLFPLMWTGMRLSRAEGAVLVLVFLGYTGMLLMSL